jgi:hypothetical protein
VAYLNGESGIVLAEEIRRQRHGGAAVKKAAAIIEMAKLAAKSVNAKKAHPKRWRK